MKINFYLKDVNSTDETLVMLYISLSGQREKFSTKLKIKPKHWNSNTQRAKTSFPNSTNFNLMLTSIEAKVNDEYTNCYVKQNDFSSTKLFNQIRSYLQGKFEASNDSLSIDSAFEKFIGVKEKILKQETMKAYTTLRNHLKSYSLFIKKELMFDDIDLTFFDDFMSYLKITCQQKTNTRSKQIKNLKSFMQYTLDRKFHKNIEFKQFTREHEKGQFVYFSKQDFNKVLTLDLNHNENLDKTRRLFCISCLTGLRFSDVVNINFKNIQNNRYNLGVVKKNTPMKIKISDKAIDYIKEYFKLYGVGGGFTSQTTNNHLTKILMQAEVNEEQVLFQKNYLGKLEEIKKPLYDWITFHYGRRYFIIQCLEKGMQPLQIMEITGHEDFSVFQAYVKFSENDSVEKLNEVWS